MISVCAATSRSIDWKCAVNTSAVGVGRGPNGWGWLAVTATPRAGSWDLVGPTGRVPRVSTAIGSLCSPVDLGEACEAGSAAGNLRGETSGADVGGGGGTATEPVA